MMTSNLEVNSSPTTPLQVPNFHHTPYYWKLMYFLPPAGNTGRKTIRISHIIEDIAGDYCLFMKVDAYLTIPSSFEDLIKRIGTLSVEENIYLLCKKLCDDGLANPDSSDLFVIFISNEKKQIPLWHQKASQRAEGVILWDYHVICVQKKRNENSSSLVWDLDSSLPFPSPLGSYVSESIRPSIQIFSEFKRFFRVVHASIFLQHFASDRRHMKDSAGNWVAEPPLHEAIVAEDGAVHNLNEYITVSPDDVVKNVEADTINVVFSEKFGVVVGENDLLGFFSLIS